MNDARPPVGLPTKLLYASGAIASSVKQRGLSTFLLIFYNQVIGLPAALVGLVIMLTLFWDAFCDPTVGQVSDNFRSPWGRRHPFMYAAAVPVALLFFLIWNPPAGMSEQMTAVYLLGCLLLIRLFDTFFELPALALAPELVSDYDKRTQLYSLRMFFNVVGGLGMTVLAYQVFLKENPDGTGGVLDRAGYLPYALTGAALIFSAILISALGTHRQIPFLSRAPARAAGLGAMLKEAFASMRSRSFVAVVLTGVFISVAGGSKQGLDLYWQIYFFELTQAQIATLTILAVGASIVGTMIAPLVAKRLGKKMGAIVSFSIALGVGASPLALRLAGVLWANGTPELFWYFVVESFISTAFSVATLIMISAMIADVVEEAEVRTGRRSEGLLLSADNLFKKAVSGVGVFVSSMLLHLVGFPEGAERGQVDLQILTNLALVYLPVAFTLFFIAILCMFLYRLDRTQHEANLQKLRAAQTPAE